MKRIVAVAVVTVGLGASAFAIGRISEDDGGEDRSPAIALASDTAEEPTATTLATHSHESMDMSMDGGAVDDRGFSKLQNGEQHAYGFEQSISDTDRAELARQLTIAREVAMQYPTVADAVAAGLHRIGPFAPGLGTHFISYDNVAGNDDGVMSDDDIRRPLAWLYDGTKSDSPVAGLFYQTPNAQAEGFAGPNDAWHLHRNVCLVARPDGTMDTPLGADQEVTQAQCDRLGGNLLEQTEYLLHVWPVAGYESSHGVFSHLSPGITCDDGTYEMADYEVIEGAAQLGSAMTVCKDGTE